jgi:hypothetical protein
MLYQIPPWPRHNDPAHRILCQHRDMNYNLPYVISTLLWLKIYPILFPAPKAVEFVFLQPTALEAHFPY